MTETQNKLRLMFHNFSEKIMVADVLDYFQEIKNNFVNKLILSKTSFQNIQYFFFNYR